MVSDQCEFLQIEIEMEFLYSPGNPQGFSLYLGIILISFSESS